MGYFYYRIQVRAPLPYINPHLCPSSEQTSSLDFPSVRTRDGHTRVIRTVGARRLFNTFVYLVIFFFDIHYEVLIMASAARRDRFRLFFDLLESVYCKPAMNRSG